MSHSVIVGILDSMVVNSLTRLPKNVRRIRVKCGTFLDKYIKKKCLRIGMDPGWALRDEWMKCAGEEFVKSLIVFWHDWKGIEVVESLGRISAGNWKRLHKMGFQPGIDKLLVKIALAISCDKRVVTHDSGFWDPKACNPHTCIGNKNACIARYLREKLNVEVCTLYQLLQEMGRRQKGN